MGHVMLKIGQLMMRNMQVLSAHMFYFTCRQLGFHQVIMKKVVRLLKWMITENSMAAKYGKVRGFGSLNQLQTIYHISKTALHLAPHDRLYTPNSTNRGNVIGPLALDDVADPDLTWTIMVKDKFTLLGRHGPRIPVGGRDPFRRRRR